MDEVTNLPSTDSGSSGLSKQKHLIKNSLLSGKTPEKAFIGAEEKLDARTKDTSKAARVENEEEVLHYDDNDGNEQNPQSKVKSTTIK